MNQEKEIENKLCLNIKSLSLSLIYVRFCFKAEELKFEKTKTLMTVDSDFNKLINIVCSNNSNDEFAYLKKISDICTQFLADLKVFSKKNDNPDKEFKEIILEAEKTVNEMCKNIKAIKDG